MRVCLHAYHRTPSINAQCRSKSWNWSEMSLNVDQCQSIPINSSQCRIKASLNINSAWSGIDRHWSELINIGINARSFDRHWALIGGVLISLYAPIFQCHFQRDSLQKHSLKHYVIIFTWVISLYLRIKIWVVSILITYPFSRWLDIWCHIDKILVIVVKLTEPNIQPNCYLFMEEK